MQWVLIILLSAPYSTQTLTMQTFSNKSTCDRAKEIIKSGIIDSIILSACVPK